MSIEQIEKTLRQSPTVKTPAGLLEKLKADITLPRARVATAERESIWIGFRRWLPGFATATILLACIVAIGVQARVLSELRQQRKELEAAAAETQQLAERSRTEEERSRIANQALELLRRDNAELEKLRIEIAELREHTQQLPALRAEREQLAAQIKAMESQLAGAASDPFAAAQDRAKSIQCVSNMKQIGLAARMWANDHGEVMPPDFLTMQNELNSPKILTCPGDTARTKVSAWNEFRPANVSYEFLVPNLSEREPPQTVMTRCPIHGHVGLLDGSVQQQPKAERLMQKNGRLTLQ